MFEDAKRYAVELECSCHIEDDATVLEDTDNVTTVNVQEHRKIKHPYKKYEKIQK